MKVSFLVTYYNQKEYVKQSMDSILAIEKPCDWEILVGDDGSTDGTIQEVKRYIEEYPDRIKMYVMPRENGKNYDSVKRASANRLNILEHSTGDFFCTLDGDDYYCDKSFVKDAVKIFGQFEDISIVAFGYKYDIDGVLEKEITLPMEITNQRVDKKTFLKNYYLPAGGCVHRKCFDDTRIKYIKQLGYFDDNNIVINSLNYGEMFAINKGVYAYRQTGQSVYTSMNKLEQAVLNVQGMDVDLRLVNSGLKKTIIERYLSSVIIMYIWRKKIYSVLEEKKYKRYEAGCQTLMPSVCFDILNYCTLSKKEKKKFHNRMKKIIMLRPKLFVKEIIKYWIRGGKIYAK